jgi:hypothetical protein
MVRFVVYFILLSFWYAPMRGLLILAMICVSCGTRTGLHKGPLDATLETTPAGDASAGDSSVRDAWPETADLGCTPLPVTWLSEPDVGTCPPTADPSACGGGDVGAVVARSAACVNAWGQVPIQCMMWKGPAANQEIVVIKLANCTDFIDSVAAFACSDHIEFTYLGHGTCQSCDGKRSDLRAFTLPLDGRPVVATGQIIEPPCLPPPLGSSTSGRTPSSWARSKT